MLLLPTHDEFGRPLLPEAEFQRIRAMSKQERDSLPPELLERFMHTSGYLFRQRPPVRSFFLSVGQFVSLVGCIGSVVGTVFAILQIASTKKDPVVWGCLYAAGGLMSFCYSAALCVVFGEVQEQRRLRLEQERREF